MQLCKGPWQLVVVGTNWAAYYGKGIPAMNTVELILNVLVGLLCGRLGVGA